ncbi:MAG: LysM peptidoglycan-binding domain-containing protein [Alphaproteobacteria bacterium]|nr:LysM peptidoglycan-binding domain-containing protein [Alphaproteobacteria bacterium]
MRRVALGLVVLLLLAAGAWWWTHRSPAPIEYVVVRGDTLSKIARAHEVTVDELRAWNGLTGDLIEVDQVLLIHTPGAEASSEAPAPSASKRTRAPPARLTAPPEAPSGPVSLPMPAAEPCVPFDADPGEEGMVTPEGLSRDQVRAGLDGVIQHALSCPREGAAGEWDLVFELTIGCDGLVSAVTVADDGGAPAAWLACATDVLRHADFPPHQITDGMPVTYPVNVAF